MKETKGFIAEFKEFIYRGNVIDMAVGVVIGGTFTAIINSLVDQVIMPFVGVLVGGIDFSSLNFTLGDAVIGYGAFIQSIINFIIISFVVFCMIKVFNSIRRKEEPQAEAPPKPSEEVVLLTEIRDLLAKNK